MYSDPINCEPINWEGDEKTVKTIKGAEGVAKEAGVAADLNTEAIFNG